jgi:hypothetical protein
VISSHRSASTSKACKSLYVVIPPGIRSQERVGQPRGERAQEPRAKWGGAAVRVDGGGRREGSRRWVGKAERGAREVKVESKEEHAGFAWG